jgi:hypothetical protein
VHGFVQYFKYLYADVDLAVRELANATSKARGRWSGPFNWTGDAQEVLARHPFAFHSVGPLFRGYATQNSCGKHPFVDAENRIPVEMSI